MAIEKNPLQGRLEDRLRANMGLEASRRGMPPVTPIVTNTARPAPSGGFPTWGTGAARPAPVSPVASSPWAAQQNDPAAGLPAPPEFGDFYSNPRFMQQANRDRIAAYRDAQRSVLADAASREADIRSRYSLSETDQERRALASQLAALGAKLDSALANIDSSFGVAGAYTKQAGKVTQKAFRKAGKQSAKDMAAVAKGTSGGFADRLAARAAEGVKMGGNAGAAMRGFGAQLAAMASQAQAGYGAEARMSEMELSAAAQAQHDRAVADRIAADQARMNAELSGVADMRSNAIFDTANAIADQRYNMGLAKQDRFDQARQSWADAMQSWGETTGPLVAARQSSAAFDTAMKSPAVANVPQWVPVQTTDSAGMPTSVQVPARENVANLVSGALNSGSKAEWVASFNEWLNGSAEAQSLARMYPWMTSEGLWAIAGRK